MRAVVLLPAACDRASMRDPVWGRGVCVRCEILNGQTPPTPLPVIYEVLYVKMTLSADELDEFEGMSDADLTKVIRDSLASFRAKRAEDDLDEADPSTPAHGGRSTSTLETGRSRSGNVNPGGATDSAISATQDAARQTHEARLRQNERDTEAERLIPGYRRL